MQRVEDFMRGFFRAETEMNRQRDQLEAELLARFAIPGLRRWSLVEEKFNKGETIEAVKPAEDMTVVTTRVSRYGVNPTHARYYLRAITGTWRIARIEYECEPCKGTGKCEMGPCLLCKGAGWLIPGYEGGS